MLRPELEQLDLLSFDDRIAFPFKKLCLVSLLRALDGALLGLLAAIVDAFLAIQFSFVAVFWLGSRVILVVLLAFSIAVDLLRGDLEWISERLLNH